MTFESAIQNRAWLLANNKEAEFEFWCSQNQCDQSSESLQFFHNEIIKTTEKEKMTRSFSNYCGFFVEWNSDFGTCRVFVLGEKEGKSLLKKIKVEGNLYKNVNGKIEKIY